MSNCIRLSDETLVSRAAAGDTHAYAELLRRYRGLVWSICLSYVANVHDCEDVTQEVFIKAFVNLRQLRSKESFGPWLSQLARRMCITRNRSKARYESAISRYSAHRTQSSCFDSSESRQAIEWKDEAHRLRAAIQSLPERTREAVYLHFCEGWPVQDAAHALGISYSAMLKRLSYGRSLLQSNLVREPARDLAPVRSNESIDKKVLAALPFLRMPNPSASNNVPRRNAAPSKRYTRALPRQFAFGAAIAVAVIFSVSINLKLPYGPAATPVAATPTAEAQPHIQAPPTVDSLNLATDAGTQPAANPATPSAPVESLPVPREATLQTGSITGTVYDADTGLGIGGVEVTAYRMRRLYEERQSAITGADGSFRIAGLHREPYEVRRGSAKGYPEPIRDERIEVMLREGETAPPRIEFPVARGLAVSGVVVDEHGAPLKNMNVRGKSGVDGPIRETQSEADGSFELIGLSETSSLLLSAEGDGFLSPLDNGFPLESSISGLRLVAIPTSTISGRVTDEVGRPVPGAHVVARDTHDSYFAAKRMRHTQTDDAGQFILQSVGAGPHSLFAQHAAPPAMNDTGRHLVDIEADSHLTNVALLLPSGNSIHVTVSDADGHALANAQVQWLGSANGRGRTDAEGRYTIEALDPNGSYRLFVSHGSYASVSLRDVVANNQEMTVTLAKANVVRGRIVDRATGNPITDFDLLLTSNPIDVIDPATVARDLTHTTSADGAFELASNSSSPAKLLIRAPGYATEVVNVDPSAAESDALVVGLVPGATVYGQIRMDGAAAPYARIVLSQEATGQPTFGVETDGFGRFGVDGLREGNADVYAVLDGKDDAGLAARELRTTVELRAAHDHELLLEFPPPAN